MKITAITQQVKNKARYSIFVDEKYSFSLSTDGVLSTGVKVGKELTESDLSQLKKQSEEGKLYDRLIGLLARRPRSSWELWSYLERKKVDKQTSNVLIERLNNKGLVDDEDFARRWVESRRQLKAISSRKLTQELMQKRISKEIISQVLSDDQTSDIDALKDLVAKKKDLSRYKNDKQKFMQFLVRQGFNYGDIKEVLENQED